VKNNNNFWKVKGRLFKKKRQGSGKQCRHKRSRRVGSSTDDRDPSIGDRDYVETNIRNYVLHRPKL